MKLADFSLLKEDNQSYVIGHPQGKSITVPKAGMSEKAQGLVSKLKREQHFDEGGKAAPDDVPYGTVPDVPYGVDPKTIAIATPPDTSGPLDVNLNPKSEVLSQVPTPVQTPNAIPGAEDEEVDSGSGAGVPADAEAAAAAAQAAPAAAPQSANPTFASTYNTGPLNQAIGDVQAGTAAEAKAGAQEQASQSAANTNAAAQLQALNARTQAADAQALKLSDAVSSGKVDPHRVWNNTSTGGKIAASLGLILGGIGSGLTHGPNMALEMMNNAIERDIDAQKNDQSKNMNLWKMNREALGNDRAATLASISQGYAIAHGQAIAAQAGAQGDVAKARMAPVILGLQQQTQQVNRQLALLNVGNQPGGTNEMDPSVYANNLIPAGPERSKALEEVGKMQQAVKLKKDFVDSYHHLNGLFDNGLLSPSDRNSAIEFLAGPLAKLSEGRFNREEAKIQTNALLPGKFESKDTTENKLGRINQFFDSLVQTPTLVGNHINPKNFKSTNLDFQGSSEHPPGSIVSIKGKNYQVGQDGKSLAAL